MRIALVNVLKLFNPYETYLTIGTPSFCPGGRWEDPPLLIIGAGLKAQGHEVELFDADNSWPIWTFDELCDRIVDYWPEVMVLPTETVDYYRSPLSSYENINKVVEGVSRKMGKSRPRNIVYGPHLVLNDPTSPLSSLVDVKIQGEGEEAVVDVVGGDSAVEGQQMVQHLDRLPLPDYSLVGGMDLVCSDFASDVKGKFTQVVSSRGCTFNCAFCVRWGMGNELRLRSPQKVLEEIEMLLTLGYESVYFIDDVWGLNQAWASEICKKLKGLGLEWTCQTQPRILSDPELVEAMAQAGCTSVGAGVESYNEDLLKAARKPSAIWHIDEAVKNCNNNGIKFIAFIVLGLPGETRRHVRNTVDWLMGNDFYGQGAFLCTPYPRTPMGGGESVQVAMCNAGLDSEYLSNAKDARRFWRDWDIRFGKPSIQETLRRYRPDVFQSYQEGVLEAEGV